ncbi:MAG: hypothetical protein ABSC11_14890 [Smithella sp.]|jgi:hypothetical protein
MSKQILKFLIGLIISSAVILLVSCSAVLSGSGSNTPNSPVSFSENFSQANALSAWTITPAGSVTIVGGQASFTYSGTSSGAIETPLIFTSTSFKVVSDLNMHLSLGTMNICIVTSASQTYTFSFFNNGTSVPSAIQLLRGSSSLGQASITPSDNFTLTMAVNGGSFTISLTDKTKGTVVATFTATDAAPYSSFVGLVLSGGITGYNTLVSDISVSSI